MALRFAVGDDVRVIVELPAEVPGELLEALRACTSLEEYEALRPRLAEHGATLSVYRFGPRRRFGAGGHVRRGTVVRPRLVREPVVAQGPAQAPRARSPRSRERRASASRTARGSPDSSEAEPPLGRLPARLVRLDLDEAAFTADGCMHLAAHELRRAGRRARL